MDKKLHQNLPSKAQPTTYSPSIFDRAFVKVVESIIHHSTFDNEEKITRKELVKKFDLFESSYQKIKTKNRGVPINKIAPIQKILVADYGVSERYLKTMQEPMFDPKGVNHHLNEPEVQYHTSQHTIELLQKDIDRLKQIINEKEKLLKEKDAMISVLNKALDIAARG